MKAKINKKDRTIVVSDIMNESQLEDAVSMADQSGCSHKSEDYSTKLIMSGTADQLNKFIKLWNE